MNPERAVEILEHRYKKQNEYNKDKYDRVSAMLPKGLKERITATGAESINGFIVDAITCKLEALEAPVKAEAEKTHVVTPKTVKLQSEAPKSADTPF